MKTLALVGLACSVLAIMPHTAFAQQQSEINILAVLQAQRHTIQALLMRDHSIAISAPTKANHYRVLEDAHALTGLDETIQIRKARMMHAQHRSR